MPQGLSTRNTPGLFDSGDRVDEAIRYYLDLYSIKKSKTNMLILAEQAKKALEEERFWVWINELPQILEKTKKHRPTKAQRMATGYVSYKYVKIADRKK